MQKKKDPPPALPPGRAGQLASERARYQLRGEEQVLEEGLGTLPPGYNLTFVRGWVRDPRHVVATWDINDEDAVRQAEAVGWDRLCVRATDPRGRVLVQLLVGRRAGTHHLQTPPGGPIRLAVGLERPDGYFLTLARSAPIHMPPDAPGEPAAAPELVRVPSRLDRRTLLRSENPARPGHGSRGRMSAAWRLLQRLLITVRILPPEKVPPELLATQRDAAARPSPAVPSRAPSGASAEGVGVSKLHEGEAITSPAGWAPPGGESAGVSSPGHWMDRWISGAPPSSTGRWPGDEPPAPHDDGRPDGERRG